MSGILMEPAVADGRARDLFHRALERVVQNEVFAVDRDLRYVYFNPVHARQMQMACGAVARVGEVMTDLVPDLTTRAQLFATLQRALAGETQRSLSWWHCGRSRERALDCTFEPVGAPGEPPIGVAVVMREAGAHEGERVAFKALERRYGALLHSSPDGVAVLSAEGVILEANNAFARLVGDPSTELPGQGWWRWAGDDSRERLLRLVGQWVTRECRFETVLRRANATFLAVEVASAPIQVDGQPAALLNVRDITDRHRRESELADREARLRLIFENAPFGIGVMDLSTGTIIDGNQGLLAIYQRTIEDLRATRVGDLTHQEDRSSERPLLSALRKGEIPGYVFRKRNLRPDGSAVPVEVRVSRLPEILGRHPMALGIVTDLHEMAEAEASLRASEEKYRRLTENAEDLVFRFRLEPAQRIEYINPAVRTLLGFTPEQCYADPELPFQRIEPEDRDLLRALLDGTLDLSQAHVLRWRHADGSLRWLEHRGRIARDRNGHPTAIEGVARDVTDRIAGEERTRILARAIEQANEAVMITDRGGRIQQVNQAFERMTGYLRSEVLGLNPRILNSGLQDQDFYVRMWTTLRAGEVFASTIRNRRKDGSVYTAEMSVTPVRNAAGQVTHYVGLQRDVTKERERAEQLRQAQKMEAMGQVTGGIAHDFNNLLTVILASAELISPELPRDSDAVHFIHDLMDAARHGSTLVRQLLAFGRQELLSPAPLDLGAAVGGFADVLRRLLPETITLPAITGEAPIAFADRGAVEQMLLNLATNARDAMPDGGTLTIELGSRKVPEGFEEGIPETTFATLTVRDTGSGMDAITKRRALEPFFTTKPPGKGTGLGLPMVLGTMQQLGGWVEIDSTPGAGTAITLGFGRGGTVPTADRATPAPTAAPAAGGRKNARVMLVEDSVQLRRVATRTLEHLGYEVVSAEDGEAGWEMWRTLRPGVDLVLTDAVMPKLSGTDLIRRIRGTGSDIPIVLASGYSPEDFADIEGQVTLVNKPWTVEQLRDKLAGALARRSA